MMKMGKHKFATLHEEKAYLNIGYSKKVKVLPKGFMVVGIITGRGTVPLFRVPSNVKINAQYYVYYVLKPLFIVHLPRLYPNEMDKVYFHHDKASSHTANLTTEYLSKMKAELGISFINKDEIYRTNKGNPSKAL